MATFSGGVLTSFLPTASSSFLCDFRRRKSQFGLEFNIKRVVNRRWYSHAPYIVRWILYSHSIHPSISLELWLLWDGGQELTTGRSWQYKRRMLTWKTSMALESKRHNHLVDHSAIEAVPIHLQIQKQLSFQPVRGYLSIPSRPAHDGGADYARDITEFTAVDT